MVATAQPNLTEAQAAEFLQLKKQTLSVWRCTKRYDLPYVKCGRSIRYRQSDLEAWVNSRTVGRQEAAE